jgi:hypothetical protein
VRHEGAERSPRWTPDAAVTAREMRVGPSESVCKGQAPNHLKLLWSKAMVVSVKAKGAARPRQVRATKTNASKPLMTCRKPDDGVKTGGGRYSGISPRESLQTARAASGMEAA